MLYFDPTLNVCPTNPNNYLLYISTNREGVQCLKAKEKSFWNIFKIALLNLFGLANNYKFKVIIPTLSLVDLSNVDRRIVDYINSRIRHYNRKYTDQSAQFTSLQKPNSSLKFDQVKNHLPDKMVETIDLDTVQLKPTAKLYEQLQVTNQFSYLEMTEKELKELLNKEPSLKQHLVAQGRFFAFDSILSIYEKGIPAAIQNSASNEEFKQQIRFIISQISKQEDDKAKQLLIELARCLEDCAAVSQGMVGMMFQKFCIAHQGFGAQLDLFIAIAKEKAVEETIYELLPDMRNPDYAKKNHNMPNLQFPHVKSGFIAVCGANIGLNIKGAAEDPNRNERLAKKLSSIFLETFTAKLKIKDIIKDFLIEVNGMHNNTIQNLDFMRWCGGNELGPESMYDESISYPDYFPKANQEQINCCAAYITAGTAIETFRKMQYIE